MRPWRAERLTSLSGALHCRPLPATPTLLRQRQRKRQQPERHLTMTCLHRLRMRQLTMTCLRRLQKRQLTMTCLRRPHSHREHSSQPHLRH